MEGRGVWGREGGEEWIRSGREAKEASIVSYPLSWD